MMTQSSSYTITNMCTYLQCTGRNMMLYAPKCYKINKINVHTSNLTSLHKRHSHKDDSHRTVTHTVVYMFLAIYLRDFSYKNTIESNDR